MRSLAGLLVLLGLGLTLAQPFVFGAAPESQPQRGGTLNFAMVAEPPGLDPHWTTNIVTMRIAMHIFETLFTFDGRSNIVPMLAERFTVGGDGKRYEITLRRDVRFHNGDTMTSADVIASLQRWGKMAGRGRALFQDLASISSPNATTVVLEFKASTGMFLTYMANPSQFPGIMPRAMAEQAGEKQLNDDQLIGTGPYRFVEWRRDQLVRLARFDRYTRRQDTATGYGGAKAAYLDQIVFHSVKDAAVRLAGLKTGQYHFAEQVSGDDLDAIKADRNLEPVINTSAPVYPGPIFNKKSGLMTNVKLRQAVAAALNMEPLLLATAKRRDLYSLNGSIFPRGNRWYTSAGTRNYNVSDAELAKRLMAEAGYRGQPLKALVQTDIQQDYQYILAAIQQLRAVGFKIDAQYTDYTTIVSLRSRPDAYNVWWAGGFTFMPDPALLIGFDCNWPAQGMGWCDRDVVQAMDALAAEPNPDRRFRIWERIHTMYWERVPFVKVGDLFLLNAIRTEVRGFNILPVFVFWNAWLTR